MPGTFRRKRKSLGPIFSVRSCTRMALCLLVRRSCSCSTFFDGAGLCLNVVLPFVSCCQSGCQCLSASFRLHVFSVDCSAYNWWGPDLGSDVGPSPFCGLLRGYVCGFIPFDAFMRWYPSRCYCVPTHLERLNPVCNLVENVRSRPAFRPDQERIAAWLSAKILVRRCTAHRRYSPWR